MKQPLRVPAAPASPTFYYYESSRCEFTGLNTLRSVKAEGCPMPDCYLNGRPVYYGDISYGGDPDECYFESASYCSTGEELDDAELSQLTDDNQEYIYEQYMEHWISKAEAYAERDR